MTPENDLARMALQEQRLRFERFDAATAWEVGTRLREAATALGKGVAIDIRLNGQLLFFTAMPGTTPDNADWIRRKVNTVQRFHTSSYAVGRKMLLDHNITLTEKYGVNAADYVAAGGCFPIRLQGTECVGTITVSGLPQRQDHALIIEVLCDLLKQPLAELALDEV